jgi:hypothetical protein
MGPVEVVIALLDRNQDDVVESVFDQNSGRVVLTIKGPRGTRVFDTTLAEYETEMLHVAAQMHDDVRKFVVQSGQQPGAVDPEVFMYTWTIEDRESGERAYAKFDRFGKAVVMTRRDGAVVAAATYETNARVVSPAVFGQPGSGLLVRFDDDDEADAEADNSKAPLLN